MKVIRVRCAEARNGPACLRPSSSKLRMRVRDASNRWKIPVQDQMRRQIRRWSKFPLDNFPRQIRNDQVLRLQFIIRHAAWFNDHKTFLAVNPAGVSKSVEN